MKCNLGCPGSGPQLLSTNPGQDTDVFGRLTPFQEHFRGQLEGIPPVGGLCQAKSHLEGLFGTITLPFPSTQKPHRFISPLAS